MSSVVRLLYGDRRIVEVEATGEICEVPSGDVILHISGSDPRDEIQLDGENADAAIVGSDRVIPLDLKRSVGYHVLKVGSHELIFATQDGKLRIKGITEIVKALSPSSALSWDRQILFSDGGALDSEHVRFAWLWRNAGDLVSALESIARSPRKRAYKKTTMSPTIRGRIDVPGTLRAIRRDASLLEPRSDGLIEYGGRRYTPSRVATVQRDRTLVTAANIQAFDLARNVVAMFTKLESQVSSNVLAPIVPAIRRLRGALGFITFRTVSRARRAFGRAHSHVAETGFDPRYAYVLKKQRELTTLGWSPQVSPAMQNLAFIRHSDEIYQAFVAISLARALGCDLVKDELRSHMETPAFQSYDYNIFYDTSPPADVLRTWRSASDEPDDPRPDVLLVARDSRNVLLFDAKYRNSGNHASRDSIYEMQYYLNTFRLRHAVICYPPADASYRDIRLISGEGYVVVALPIAPAPDTIEFLSKTALPKVLSLLERPN